MGGSCATPALVCPDAWAKSERAGGHIRVQQRAVSTLRPPPMRTSPAFLVQGRLAATRTRRWVAGLLGLWALRLLPLCVAAAHAPGPPSCFGACFSRPPSSLHASLPAADQCSACGGGAAAPGRARQPAVHQVVSDVLPRGRAELRGRASQIMPCFRGTPDCCRPQPCMMGQRGCVAQGDWQATELHGVSCVCVWEDERVPLRSAAESCMSVFWRPACPAAVMMSHAPTSAGTAAPFDLGWGMHD